MYVSTLCIEKQLLHDNRELFLSLDGKKTILTCNSSIYDTSDVSEIAYPLNSGNEVVAYLNELRDRRINLKHAVLIHRDEAVLRQASKAGLYTIGIGVDFAYTSLSYESIAQMLNEAKLTCQLKQRRQNICLVIAVVLFLVATFMQNDLRLFTISLIGSILSLIIALVVYPEKSFWRIVSFFLDGIM